MRAVKIKRAAAQRFPASVRDRVISDLELILELAQQGDDRREGLHETRGEIDLRDALEEVLCCASS